jgi:hypothetical protein
MPELSVLLLAACMFLGAALYTSVGHAGASAYIALMALFGVAPAVMRPGHLRLTFWSPALRPFAITAPGYSAGARFGRSFWVQYHSLSSGAQSSYPAHTTVRWSVLYCYSVAHDFCGHVN